MDPDGVSIRSHSLLGFIKVLNETKDAFDFQLDALPFGGLLLG